MTSSSTKMSEVTQQLPKQWQMIAISISIVVHYTTFQQVPILLRPSSMSQAGITLASQWPVSCRLS
jgi:hypothetical protein